MMLTIAALALALAGFIVGLLYAKRIKKALSDNVDG